MNWEGIIHFVWIYFFIGDKTSYIFLPELPAPPSNLPAAAFVASHECLEGFLSLLVRLGLGSNQMARQGSVVLAAVETLGAAAAGQRVVVCFILTTFSRGLASVFGGFSQDLGSIFGDACFDTR